MSAETPTPTPSDKTVQLDPTAFVSSAPPQIPDHELLRRVGEGAYGEVWLARNVMGTYRAVKIVYRRSFSDERPYEREFAGIKKFEPISRAHGSQVDILHVGRNDAAGYFFYVMELADDACETPKPETRNPNEIRNPKSESVTSREPVRASDFELPSDFGIRNSDLYTPRTLKLDLHRRGHLPFDEWLHLALARTTALEHLHQNCLMHRDVKPANIIFINGQPKLADIGLVADVDATKSFVGTEGYIPPEGPTSPQADIYSLGKVIYEAATGRERQDFPELPTNVVALPERTDLIELNEVILKACASDTKHRYQNARAMHADLLLLKTGKSVKHTRRLERRLTLVTRVGVVAAVSGALALAAFFYQKQQARRAFEVSRKEQRLRQEADTERQRAVAAEKAAKTEASKSQQVTHFLQNMLQGVDPYVAMGRDTTLLREILDRTAERVAKDLKDQPEVEAAVCQTLGNTHGRLTLIAQDETMHRQALRLRTSVFGNVHSQIADSLYNLAGVLTHEGKLAEAETIERQALAMRNKLFGTDHRDIADALS